MIDGIFRGGGEESAGASGRSGIPLAVRRLGHIVIAMFAPVGFAPAGLCLPGAAAARATQVRLES